jgi:hypothetical protein
VEVRGKGRLRYHRYHNLTNARVNVTTPAWHLPLHEAANTSACALCRSSSSAIAASALGTA